MVESKHNDAIDGRRRLIDVNVLDPEEAAEYSSIDVGCSAFYEEDDSGSGEEGVSTGVTEVQTKEVEEVQ